MCCIFITGELPIEAYLDSKKLNFFGSIARQADSEVHELAIRQLAMKDSKSKSWFIDIVELFSKYGLGHPIDILQKPLSKIKWKNIVKKEIHKHFLRVLLVDASTKSTLKNVIFCGVSSNRIPFGTFIKQTQCP